MLDAKKTKAQLVKELTTLKTRLRRLEAARSTKTDRRLREWIQRYELVVAASGQIAYEYDVPTGRILWGATIEKVLGYSMKEIGGGFDQWVDLLHPEDSAAILARLQEAEATCSYWDEQYRMRHKDGHYVWIRDRGFFVADRAGRAARQLGVLENVTEHKEAEESLARSREQASFLAQMLERSSQPFGVGHPDGRMVVCNTAFLQLMGYSREDLANLDWLRDLTAPEWRDTQREKLNELRRTGQPVRYERECIRKDGSRVPVELLVHLERDEQGNPKHYYAFLTDISERKQAENALRTSESFLRSVVEQNPCPVWISDDKGTLLRLNQALRELLQASDEELVGKYNIFNDNILEEAGVVPQIRRVFEEGRIARFEIEYDTSRLKGLSLERTASAILDVTIFPIRNAAGRITNAVIQHVDITERKRTERALAEAEAEKGAVLDSMAEMVTFQDLNHRILWVNKAVAEGFGKDAEEIVGRTCYEALHGRTDFCQDCPVVKARDTGRPHEVEMTSPDGRVWMVKGSPVRDAEGNTIGLLDMVLDITERKQAEWALRRSEEQNRRIVETASEGIWTVDRESRTTFVNRRMAEMLGYDSQEMIGRSAHAFIYDEDLTDHEAKLAARLKGSSEIYERRLRRKDGTELWTIVSATTLFGPSGEPLGSFAMFTDITERKRMERTREATIELLGLCNAGGDLRKLVQDLTAYFQRLSGCEAVGIRLRDGDDFPYYETRGFPPEFVLAESRLCAVDQAGKLIRDSAGNPVIECMCGNILCGRFDPSKPFFTTHGSFWSNCTTDLLAGTTEADRQAHTRNRCNGQGYESVALLPLRSGGKTFGLLQLNDKRRDRFSRDLIARYERLADYMAIALLHRLATEELSLNERKLSNAVRIARLGYWEYDVASDLFTFDDHFYDIFRTSADKVGGYTMTPRRYAELFLHPDDAHMVADEIRLAMSSDAPDLDRYLEHRIKYADGEIGYIGVRFFVVKDEQGRTIKTYGANQDITERKRAEEGLRESEQRLHSIVDGSPIPTLVIDRNHRVIAWNRAMAEYTGLPAGQLIGSSQHWRAFYPAEQPIMADLLVDAAADQTTSWYPDIWKPSATITGAYEAVEYFPNIKDGRWMLFTAAPLRDTQGQVAGAVETFQDITERKQVETALREAMLQSERDRGQLEAVFQAVSDGIVLTDMAGKFLMVNEAEAEIAGYASPAEMLTSLVYSEQVFELKELDGRLLPLEEWPLSKVLRGESVVNWELYARRKDTGQEWFFSYSGEPVRNDREEQILAVVITRDITEKKRGERALQASEARYRALVEQIPLVTYTAAIDETSTTTYVSPQIERMIGYSPRDYVADPGIWNEALHPEDRERVLSEVSRTHASDAPFASEYRMVARDGRVVWVRDEAAIVRDPRGRPVCLQGVMSDITERKQAEEALRESEERFREVVENINEVLWLTDWVHRELLYVSPSYETVYGRSRESLYKDRRSWIEAIHPEDRARINRTFAEKGERGEYTEEEYRITQPDGSLRWIRDRSFPIYNAKGEVTRWVGVAEDFTERKHAEDALRRERDFAEGLIETAQAIILVLDTQGRIVRFNPYLERISGYRLTEVQGADWFDTFLPQQGRAQTREVFLNAINSIQTIGNVDPILTKDGRLLWIEWNDKTLKDEKGSVVGLLAVGQDITERRRGQDALRKAHDELEHRVRDRTAELTAANQRLQVEIGYRQSTEVALRDSRDLLRAVMDGITDVIFTKDLQGRFCLVNTAITRLTGKRPQEVVGRSSKEVFPAGEGYRRLEEDEVVIQTKAPAHWELTVLRAGQPRHFLLSKMPHLDSHGEVVGVIGIARDITEFKQTQERLRQAERLASIGTLAAGIAHEINNPVGAIYLAAQNAMSCLVESGDHQEAVKCLHDILEDAVRCGQIVKNVLCFAKEEPLEKAPAELAVIIEKAVDNARPFAEERGVALDLVLPLALPRILANRTAMLQAMENVIRNAIQASDTGCHVKIGLKSFESGVSVEVTDLGVGLTTEQQEHMFDPFFTSRRTEGGTGLGLSIVHGVVADHAGTIHVESTRGQGTKVTISLPTCPDFDGGG